ncbi:G-type lectin S-receptor-like serine/threonine-protein kinase At1g11330 isoform X1 [Prosopis cineraria]|uniref:G-type lectin S-receptor-like serine/threonine-protein kinase At1g11330 isoform X1 n=2 Tax=Prosopis cineraria TaxID=364024 RepID=UPI00240F91AE|nr:G-type lectin S-receptor-like serine/threonine-protein kinase At1g11330 isoform X1 [Prosopis cineraria]
MGISSLRNLLPVFLVISGFCADFCTASDTITTTQFIRDSEIVRSNNSEFELGFFSPENATNRYVGIWYVSDSNVIWVANRNQPLKDSSGILTISGDNNLVVLNGDKEVAWTSNISNKASNSTAQLLNTGNLVLLDDTGRTLWESFQHPGNSFLPNLVISTNQKTGEKLKVTSWKSPSDPSIGTFSSGLERPSTPEVFIWNQTQPYWRSGPWNGQVFIGLSKMYTSSYLNGFDVGREENGSVHITYSLPNGSFFGTIVLSSEGKLVLTTWMNKHKVGMRTVQDSICDMYGLCGTFGSCDPRNSPICSCLRGFEPRNAEEWNRRNWTSGCMRRASLRCGKVKNGRDTDKDDGFLKLPMTKVPDFAEKSYGSEEMCRIQCLNNCNCTAYAYDAAIGCMSWNGNLIDVVRFSRGGVDLYIREAYSELEREKKVLKVVIIVTVAVGVIIIVAAYIVWWWAARHFARRKGNNGALTLEIEESHLKNHRANLIEDLKIAKLEELPLFDFGIIATATNNFSFANKLGRGGFGTVYKGELRDGQEIAVKRLSRASGQGLEEFMNEVVVISKLQHRNLVRLLGCCIEGEEKMLIYEYMPNKSLDAFVFDPIKKKALDWKKRLNIIEGISRGVLYLHRDSRLKIIHRDLKPSNILLDGELNPKISDFGMARIFQNNEDEGNTRRVVGTYGYMSPEYAMEGLFSEKSDVFSFGVLLLEIISGTKVTSFYVYEHSLSLLGFAWKSWNEEDIITFIDPEISAADFINEVRRCMHIGLLCVQELARDRPSMATVMSMLNSDIVNLPPPCHPAFNKRQGASSSESSQQSNKSCSLNSVTLTNMQGR